LKLNFYKVNGPDVVDKVKVRTDHQSGKRQLFNFNRGEFISTSKGGWLTDEFKEAS